MVGGWLATMRSRSRRINYKRSSSTLLPVEDYKSSCAHFANLHAYLELSGATLLKTIRNLLITIRKYGVPTEETIALPVVSLMAVARALDRKSLEVWIAETILISLWSISGLWLGIAWEGFKSVKVAIRVWTMAVLAVAGYACVTDLSYPKTFYAESATTIISSLGFLFYTSWFFGSLIRESLLVPLTEEQRAIGVRRRLQMRRVLMEVFAFREDQMNWETILGRVIRWTIGPAILLWATSKGWNEIIKYLGVFSIVKPP